YQFWENILFSAGTYDGNPMIKHREINQLKPITMDNFQQWIHLFNETVDELYQGEKAELIKKRAQSIATVMQIKLINE
ncbi:MAG TPA: group III truncated hemoglobin, partial [Saprospiraceae bacterium]|nr:group III truncated hemoglobin [Saprospiraceae bacterium]